jgi:hypothetical protein
LRSFPASQREFSRIGGDTGTNKKEDKKEKRTKKRGERSQLFQVEIINLFSSASEAAASE